MILNMKSLGCGMEMSQWTSQPGMWHRAFSIQMRTVPGYTTPSGMTGPAAQYLISYVKYTSFRFFT